MGPGGQGYPVVQGYTMPGHQMVQFGGPNVNATTTSAIRTIQPAPYPTGTLYSFPKHPNFSKIIIEKRYPSLYFQALQHLFRDNSL